MHGVIAAGSAWSLGASMLTFAFPMILFIVVAAALWVLYTTPHLVPGLRYRPEESAARAAPTAAGSSGQDSQAEGGQGSSPESGTDSQAGGTTEGF